MEVRAVRAAAVMIDKMRYVHQDIDRHGNVRVYVWRGKGHPKTRIREQPGTPEFRAAYDAALASPPKQVKKAPAVAQGGTYLWLCRSYFASAEFKQLEVSTQTVRRRALEAMAQEPIAPKATQTFADVPIDRFSVKAVRVLRDRKVDTPAAANNRVKFLRALFAWGMEAEPDVVLANPARDVAGLKEGGDGHHSWTPDEVRQFEDRHPSGSKARRAMALLLYTSQRRSDVVQFGRQHVSSGWLNFTQFKNRNSAPVTLSIPIDARLQAELDQAPAGDLIFLTTEYGKPFTANGFGNWFRDRCDEAGLKHCSAHGLRKAAAAMLAENDATDRQIMAVTGHKTSKEIDRYTRGARQKRLAGQAMAKLAADES